MATNQVLSQVAEALAADLREWAAQEVGDWDALVSGDGAAPPTDGNDLWDSMPELDSKAVARSSPIFEKHLGVPLDVKNIRPGGYISIDDFIDHLVPLMEAAASEGDRSER